MEQLSDQQLINIIFSESESDEDSFLMNFIFEDIPIKSGREQRKKKKNWVRPYYADRDNTGAYQNIFLPLKFSDPELFQNYTRMSCSQFDELLTLVKPAITKQEYLREVIQPSTRLAITLKYLATGESQKSLSTVYKCSPASVHFIIKETTQAIVDSLRSKVFKKINEEYFIDVANGFGERWNFPHCIGAIDGKHVSIQAPSFSGSTFFNYKKHYSIVLMAVADHDYNFMMCDIGAAGRQSDGGTSLLRTIILFAKMKNKLKFK